PGAHRQGHRPGRPLGDVRRWAKGRVLDVSGTGEPPELHRPDAQARGWPPAALGRVSEGGDAVNLLDRAIRAISPGWHAKRELARFRADAIRAYYDGATIGRRGASIRRSAADANVITAATLPRLRAGARDLTRNNPWALSAVEAIVAETVGTGIDPQFMRNGERALDIEELERRHLDTTACDAAGKLNYHGLVSLTFRTIVESGEVIIRRRWRRLSDGLPVPIQFQVLEPDYLDISKDGPTPTGGRIVQGVEFDAIG